MFIRHLGSYLVTSLQYLWNIVGVLYDIIDNTIAGDLYDAASYSQALLAIVTHAGALSNALNLQYFKRNLSVSKGIFQANTLTVFNKLNYKFNYILPNSSGSWTRHVNSRFGFSLLIGSLPINPFIQIYKVLLICCLSTNGGSGGMSTQHLGIQRYEQFTQETTREAFEELY